MDKADFEEWLESPATEYFRKYLIDSGKEESKMVADAILNGEVIPLDDQIRISTMSMMFTRIAEIDFDEIESFYEKT